MRVCEHMRLKHSLRAAAHPTSTCALAAPLRKIATLRSPQPRCCPLLQPLPSNGATSASCSAHVQR